MTASTGLLYTAAVAAAASTAAASPTAATELGRITIRELGRGDFELLLDGAAFAASAPIRVSCDGAQHTVAAGSLVLSGEKNGTGADVLGAWTERRFIWKVGVVLGWKVGVVLGWKVGVVLG